MNGELDQTVLGVAAIFARVGGLFLIAPGLSSARIPVQAKLFLALGIALAISPLVLPAAVAALGEATPADIVALLAGESFVGLTIGLLARLLLMALQTMTVAIANMAGLGALPGLTLEAGEPSQAAATLFMATAVTVIFLADLHHEMIRGLFASYEVVQPGLGFDVAASLTAVADRITDAFLVALRIAAPFFVYSVIVHLAVGIVNKLTPTIPVFFVALPFITAGGLVMMALAVREMMFAFADAFAQLTAGL